ncbi:MAG: PD-(D/E)XK nuclease family protein [Planctomycetota bacterium]
MKELRWCRVLCWLLETSSGAAGATELQQRICSLARVDDHVSFSAIGREITEGDSRYDVVLVGQDLDLVIEAKVNAPSDMNQLDQYRQAFLKGTKKFAGLFLTKKKEKPDNWESATWCELAEVLEDICLSNKDNEGRADRMWNLIANDFAIYIKTMTS